MADKFQLKAIITAVDKLTPTLKTIQRSVRVTHKSLRDIGTAGSDLFGKIGISTAALGGSLAFAGSKILGTSAQFEDYQAVLETIEGSSEKARNSMAWVQDFAAKTPYELGQVTDAFVKLKAYGIEPQGGALTAAGDAASAMGKDVMQAVEALADAMTGENERLKEFGIKANKVGDDFVYTWVENGKTMAAKANANSKEVIQSTITGIWNRRYGGAMDKRSKTWNGMWSNMLDQVTKFTKMIGDAGVFDAAKQQLAGVLALFDKWEKDGTLKRIAGQISGELTRVITELVGWVKQVDWAGVIRGIAGAVKSVAGFVESIGGMKTVLIALGVAMAAGPLSSILSIGMALSRLLLVAGPVGWVIAAIAAAGYLIYTNWSSLSGIFGALTGSVSSLWGSLVDLWNVLAPLLLPVLKLVGQVVGGVLIGTIKTLTLMVSGLVMGLSGVVSFLAKVADFVIPDWLVGMLGGGDISVTGKQAAAAPSASSRTLQAAAGTRLNGEMTVRFENAPAGMRVDAGRTNQSGVSMNPDVGYRSLGAA